VRRAVLVPLLAAGCAFVFVFVLLPRPSRADDFALRVLSRLERVRISGSVIHLRGATIIARCTELHDRRVEASAAALPLLAAEADLAGPRLLYVHELIGREAARAAVVRAVGGTYLVRLSGAGPHVDLVVSRPTLRPIAIEYRSRLLTARATLVTGRRGC
jgi:hypothetical protein